MPANRHNAISKIMTVAVDREALRVAGKGIEKRRIPVLSGLSFLILVEILPLSWDDINEQAPLPLNRGIPGFAYEGSVYEIS